MTTPTARVALTRVTADAAGNATLVVSVAADPGVENLALVVDGVPQPGSFVGTIYGFLYRAPDGEWGLSGLGYGSYAVDVTYTVTEQLDTGPVSVYTPAPPSTLAGTRLQISDVLDLGYHAGFTTEATLLPALAIAIAESGLWTEARKWYPPNWRAATDAIDVPGPSLAWNKTHTQQAHSDRGLWQINSQYHGNFSDAACDQPAQAAQIVATLSSGGTNWMIWSSYASGLAQAHYDTATGGWPALRPLVDQYLAGK